MKKAIEETLADYLLGLTQGSWTAAYHKACFEIWRETYGEKVVTKVAALVAKGTKK